MTESERIRDYPLKKRKGELALDRHQKWVQETNRDLVDYVVRDNPWLNINQITDQVAEVRERWLQTTKAHRKNGDRQLPKGRPTRKTVSNHLKALMSEGRIAEIGGRFASAYDYVASESKALAKSVKRLFRKAVFDQWSFIPAARVAGFFTLADPDPDRPEIQDLKALQQERFKNNLFWLDDILRDAICTRKMSPKIYSNGVVNVDLLQDGWRKFFGNTRVYLLASAINPREFLGFLVTHPGRVLLDQWLKDNWEKMRTEVDTDVERFNLDKIDWSDSI